MNSKEGAFGSVGEGSLYHLMGERLAAAIGAQMIHVPYKGAAPLMNDLMGGQFDVTFLPVGGSTVPAIHGGRVKALAITAQSRHPLLPNVPAISDSKVLRLPFNFDVWSGIMVVKSVDDQVAMKIQKAVFEALTDAELRKSIESRGTRLTTPLNQKDLDKFYAEEIQRYRQLGKNLTPQ